MKRPHPVRSWNLKKVYHIHSAGATKGRIYMRLHKR